MEDKKSDTTPIIPPGELTSPFPTQVFVASPAQGNQAYPMQQYPQQPVVSSAPGSNEPLRLKARAVYGLGIASCSIGILILICGIVATSVFGGSSWNIASGGIWGGLLIIACGSFSIFAAFGSKRRLFNTLNLAFNVFAFVICLTTLVIYCLAIRIRKIINSNCISPRDGPFATYGILIALTIIQMVLSTTIVVLCIKAYPEKLCSCCCTEPNESSSRYQHPPTVNYQTGYATVSPNVQSLPPGQILYMLTPVAVTTQNPQNVAGAHGNALPQATLVMA